MMTLDIHSDGRTQKDTGGQSPWTSGGILWPPARTQTCVDSVKGLAPCTRHNRSPGLCTRSWMGVHVSTAAQSHASIQAPEAPPRGHVHVHTIPAQVHAGRASRTGHTPYHRCTRPCTPGSCRSHSPMHTAEQGRTHPRTHQNRTRGPWHTPHTHTHTHTHTHLIAHAGGAELWAETAARGAPGTCPQRCERRGGGSGGGWGRGLRRQAQQEPALLLAALGPHLHTPFPPRAPPRGPLPRAPPLAGPPLRPRGAARRPCLDRGTGWRWGCGAEIGAGPGRAACVPGSPPKPPPDPEMGREAAADASISPPAAAEPPPPPQLLPPAAETRWEMGELTLASWGARAAAPASPHSWPSASISGLAAHQPLPPPRRHRSHSPLRP